MNDKAKVLATGFVRAGGAGNILHIYDDGLVVVLEGVADRHLCVPDVLKRQFPTFGEAKCQSVSVFVVPFDVGDIHPIDLPPILVGVTDHYHDHRREDWHTIEMAVDLFESALAVGIPHPKGT